MFFGSVMIFTGLLNLIAFQQAPRRVASITVFLNFFNAHVAAVVFYNYSGLDYLILTIIWIGLALAYLFATIRQVYSLIMNKKYRQKQKRKIS